MERYTDVEFLNALESAGPNRLPPGARVLILELFYRVQEIENRTLGARVGQLKAIARGMEEDVERLGTKPDLIALRNGLRSVMTAVRDFAQTLHETDSNAR